MIRKLNFIEGETQRILSLHKSAVLKESRDLINEASYKLTLIKRDGWNSGGLKDKYDTKSLKVTKSNKYYVEGEVYVKPKGGAYFRFDCNRPQIMTITTSGWNGSEYEVNDELTSVIKWYCAGKPNKNNAGGGSNNQQKSNDKVSGGFNKTNGTYTLGTNQSLSASVDFNTKFPKTIPAGTVIYHDYRKNDTKILLGNTGVVTYCNRNTFIYNDGVDDLKNDGMMNVIKYYFCNGDKLKTWKELTYTPKEKVSSGGDNVYSGGSGGGGNYSFDYQTVNNAIQQKFPEDDVVNPFGQGSEGEVPLVNISDEMYSGL